MKKYINLTLAVLVLASTLLVPIFTLYHYNSTGHVATPGQIVLLSMFPFMGILASYAFYLTYAELRDKQRRAQCPIHNYTVNYLATDGQYKVIQIAATSLEDAHTWVLRHVECHFIIELDTDDRVLGIIEK